MQALDSLRGMLDKPESEPDPRSAGAAALGEIPVLTDVVEPGSAGAAAADEHLAVLQSALDARIEQALEAATRSMSEELKRQLHSELQSLLQTRTADTGRSGR